MLIAPVESLGVFVRLAVASYTLPGVVGASDSAWGFAAGTGALWGLSYFFWRRLEAIPAGA